MATPVSTVGSERETFDALITRANEYYQQSRWQEQLHVLQEALTVSSKSTFPDSHRYRQEVLLELGGLRRRLGQYDECKRMLHDALNANDDPNAFPAMRVKILGELGTMYMHRGDFSRAQKTFRDQFNFSEGTSIAAETGRCYAIRNQGIAAYNLSQQAQQQYREGLLKEAMQDVETGMKLAQSLHDRLEKEEPGSPNIWYIVRWQVSCIDRLAICYVAAGNHRKAAKLVAKSQTIQDELRRRRGSEESDLRAYSNFFYGKVLYATGQKEEALKAWNPGPGQCSSAIALCKEPSKEHAGYLKELADAGCDFSSYDEQGFSALDYAEMSDIAYKMGMTQTILDSFRRDLRVVFASQEAHLSESQISTMVKAEIQTRRAQAKVRWCYRDILQEKVRPELRKHNTDAIGNLRTIYANSLTMDKWKRRTLDWFRYVEYNEFKRLGRLPIADEDREVTNEWSTRAIVDSHEIGGDQSNVFIVFFSYRWIGASRDPPIEGPDDAYNTQYRRMLQALELLLEEQKEVSPDNVGIWLDCACISQRNPELREKGVNALPLAVTQCDAVISLVDNEYYSRAWCSVEVMLALELQRAYKLHDWWVHLLSSPKNDRVNGSLKRGNTRLKLDLSEKKLSKEELDRPKVEFLMRQSKLLGMDHCLGSQNGIYPASRQKDL